MSRARLVVEALSIVIVILVLAFSMNRSEALVPASQPTPSPRIVPVADDEIEVTRDFTTVPTVSISGKIEFEDGAPVSSASLQYIQEIAINRSRTLAAPDGTFVIEVPPLSEGFILAQVPGQSVAFSEVIKVRVDSIEGIRIVVGKAAEVTGVVKGPDGTPFEGATLSGRSIISVADIYHLESLPPSTTDAMGRFRLGELPAGELSISTKGAGYAPSAVQTLTLKAGERREGVELLLQKPHYIAGVIVDADEAPVAGAFLHVYSTKGEFESQGSTDSSGRFRIEGAPDAPIKGAVFYKGNTHTIPKFEIDNDAQVLVIGGAEGTTLIGRVVDDATGDLIDNFNVSTDGMSGGGQIDIDADNPGQFRWQGLGPDLHQAVVITAEGYATYNSESIEVESGQKEVRKTFRLGRGSTVRGRLVDKVTRKPVPGAVVQVSQNQPQFDLLGARPVGFVKSDAEGAFEMRAIPAGEITVHIESPKYPYKSLNAITSHGETTNIGDVELDTGGRLSLLFVDGVSGQPVPGIEFELFRGPYYVGESLGKKNSDINGIASYDGIVDDTYYAGLLDSPFYVDLDLGQADESGSRTYTIPSGRTTLKGTVLKDGKPLVGRVMISSMGTKVRFSSLGNVESNTDGKFEVPNMVAGKWTLSFVDHARTGASYSVNAIIPATDVYEHTFTIPAESQ